MKNPYLYFTSNYYTTTEIDEIVYNITISGVTQQQLDDATDTFLTSDEIDTSYSASTSTYLTLDEIDETGSAYTDGFIYTDEIDTKISGFTTDFLTSPEIDVVFSAHTSELQSESEAQTEIDRALEVSMTYWHPSPYYERTFITDHHTPGTSLTIGNTAGDSGTTYISGNTYWERTLSPAEWLDNSLIANEGTGTTELIFTATDNNASATARTTPLYFDSDNTVNMPDVIWVKQLGGYVAP